MNASQLFQDIEGGFVTEVETAKCHFDDQARGVLVRQSFYVYPDDTIVSLLSSDGRNECIILGEHDAAALRSRNPSYFYANH